MSLSSATNRNDYTGNGSVDTYSYTFKVFSEDHLVVTVRDTSDVETTLTKTTHYTVSGVGSTNGGSVALVAGAFDWLNVGNDLKSGYRLTIRRVVPLTQETDIRNAGTFYPATHEDQFDKQVMISQQQQDDLDRSVTLPETVTSSDFDPTLPSDILDSANKVPMVNATGDGFTDAANWPTANEISSASASALAASDSADLAEDWAIKTDGIVAATDYAAKAWAIGGTGVTDTASRGAAKEWATKTGGTVDGTEYSAKKYAQDAQQSAIDAATVAAASLWDDVIVAAFGDSPIAISDTDSGVLYAIDCTGGNVVVNLPEISTLTLSGPWSVGFKKTDSSSNTITINRGGSDTIDGSSSYVISRAQAGAVLIPDTDFSPDEWTAMAFGEVPISGAIVGTTDSQVLTNKDYDGGTASDTSRLTVPKNTKSNLDALTRKEATLVFATDEAKAYVDDGTNLIPVGSGSGGGINYIENGDAEIASPAPSLYSDTAAAMPVDGTGGSVNTSTELDFSRSTSSPLRGSASWVFDKKSGDQQGKGGSFPFTIDVADKGKQVQITFDYSVLSGTYATGDVAVYVVHDPSGTPKVIQPSAFNIESVGIESLARLTFQTEYSSVLDYNLCFHVASTSASAYSLKFDNINLGPQVVPMGAPVTGAVVKTTSGSWASNTTYTMYETQVGDTAFYRVRLALTGAPTSTTLTVNLPAGRVIDTTKITSNSASYLGSGVIRDNDTTARYNVNVQYNSTTSVFLQAILPASGSTHATATVDQANPITFAASDSIDFTFSVPIVGWSSSTVVSSSADTRVVAARAYRATDQTGINPNNTYVKLTYNTADFDTAGCFDTSNSRFTVKVPGKYRIAATAFIQATNTLNNVYGLGIYKNGSIASAGEFSTNSTAAAFFSRSATTDLRLVAGDYIEIYLFGQGNNSASTLTMTGGITVSSFSVDLIQGPSQIAASEVIACRAYLSANQTGVNTNLSHVKVNFNATTLDTHGGWNAGTYRYTAPAPGIYEVATTIYTSATNVLANIYHPSIYVNGASVQFGHPVPSIASTATGGYANWIGELNAGDYVEIYWYGAGNNSASTMTIFGPSGTKNSSVHIKRLGGM